MESHVINPVAFNREHKGEVFSFSNLPTTPTISQKINMNNDFFSCKPKEEVKQVGVNVGVAEEKEVDRSRRVNDIVKKI